jgi:hypothetical protein
LPNDSEGPTDEVSAAEDLSGFVRDRLIHSELTALTQVAAHSGAELGALFPLRSDQSALEAALRRRGLAFNGQDPAERVAAALEAVPSLRGTQRLSRIAVHGLGAVGVHTLDLGRPDVDAIESALAVLLGESLAVRIVNRRTGSGEVEWIDLPRDRPAT